MPKDLLIHNPLGIPSNRLGTALVQKGRRVSAAKAERLPSEFGDVYGFSFNFLKKIKMARPSKLASMSVEALIRLRDDIGRVLSRKAAQLQSELAALGDGGWITSGRKAAGRSRASKLKGRKVAPKYRNPKNRSETWAGRGAMPRWMAYQIKAGKKREDFAIDKAATKSKKGRAKKARGKRKTGSVSRKTTPKPLPASSTSEATS
jgi:DNA-binding protein H-NS